MNGILGRTDKGTGGGIGREAYCNAIEQLQREQSQVRQEVSYCQCPCRLSVSECIRWEFTPGLTYVALQSGGILRLR